MPREGKGSKGNGLVPPDWHMIPAGLIIKAIMRNLILEALQLSRDRTFFYVDETSWWCEGGGVAVPHARLAMTAVWFKNCQLSSGRACQFGSAVFMTPWNLCRGVYSQAEPGFSGRCTAPLLLDRRSRRVISNESEDIVRLLNGLHLPGCPDTDLRGPADQLPAIQQLCDTIYNTVLP